MGYKPATYIVLYTHELIDIHTYIRRYGRLMNMAHARELSYIIIISRHQRTPKRTYRVEVSPAIGL